MNADNIRNVGFASERRLRELVFTIPGNPIPLQRPRMSAGHVWDSQKQEKMVAGLCLEKLLKENDEDKIGFFTGPLFVTFKFYMAIPVRTTEFKRKQIQGDWCLVHKDLDNLIKFYSDVANGILYSDDSTIVQIAAEKRFDDGSGPRTIMTILQLRG